MQRRVVEMGVADEDALAFTTWFARVQPESNLRQMNRTTDELKGTTRHKATLAARWRCANEAPSPVNDETVYVHARGWAAS
jgi:hypothetical protein